MRRRLTGWLMGIYSPHKSHLTSESTCCFFLGFFPPKKNAAGARHQIRPWSCNAKNRQSSKNKKSEGRRQRAGRTEAGTDVSFCARLERHKLESRLEIKCFLIICIICSLALGKTVLGEQTRPEFWFGRWGNVDSKKRLVLKSSRLGINRTQSVSRHVGVCVTKQQLAIRCCR